MSAGNVEELSRTTMSGKIVETLGDILLSGFETTAQFSLGQTLLRATDRLLWVVEKSAQWSLPVQEVTAEENGKAFGKIELVRPLPWIFFLPSLVMLRAIKFGLNFGAFIIGYPQLEAIGIVKIVQKGRRKLRSIKSNGLKTIRCRKGSRNREEELNEAKKSLINSMLSTLSALSCIETSRRTPSPPPTRVYVNRGAPEATATPGEESTTESTSPHADGKRKYSQVEALDDSSDQSEDESVRAKLERLAAEDSDTEDQDFDPAKDELAMVSGVSTGSSGEEDEDEDDDHLSDTEIENLRQACFITGEQIAATSARVDEIIVEEPEMEPEFEASSTPKKKSFENSIGDVDVDVVVDDEETGKSLSVDNRSLPENVTSTPELQSSKKYEDTNEKGSKFYSPINSPAGGGDSVSDFETPKKNDDDEKPEKQITQQTDNKTVLETSEKDKSVKDIKETQLDKGDKEKKSSTVSPKIRTDEATSNKNKNKNKNGLTADEKERSKLVPTGVKTQDKDKQPKLSESKKK